MSKYSIVMQFLLAPIIAAIIVAALFGAPIYDKLMRLATVRANGNNADAIVIAKHCENHGGVEYEFSTKAGRHTSQSFSCFQRCDAVAIGDHLNVWYLEKDPAATECGNLDEKIENQMFGLAAVPIALVLFAAGCLWKCMAELRKSRVMGQPSSE